MLSSTWNTMQNLMGTMSPQYQEHIMSTVTLVGVALALGITAIALSKLKH